MKEPINKMMLMRNPKIHLFGLYVLDIYYLKGKFYSFIHSFIQGEESHCTHADVRRQPEGIGSFLVPCRLSRSKSGY